MTRMIEDHDINEDNSYTLITRTTFRKGEGFEPENISKSIRLPGRISKILMTCNLYVDAANIKNFKQDTKYFVGIKGMLFYHMNGKGLSHFANVKTEGDIDVIEFFKMPVSLSILLTTCLKNKQSSTMNLLRNLSDPPVSNVSIGALNHLLFLCDKEEQDYTKKKRSLYEFNGLVPKYSGIAGCMHEIMKNESQSPIFENIREGNWLIDYTFARANEFPELKEIRDWLEKYLLPIKDLSPELRPRWFVHVISKLFYSIWNMMIMNSDPFFVRLILINCRVQMSFAQDFCLVVYNFLLHYLLQIIAIFR